MYDGTLMKRYVKDKPNNENAHLSQLESEQALLFHSRSVVGFYFGLNVGVPQNSHWDSNAQCDEVGRWVGALLGDYVMRTEPS